MITKEMLRIALEKNIIHLKTQTQPDNVLCIIGQCSIPLDSEIAKNSNNLEDGKIAAATPYVVNKLSETIERLNNNNAEDKATYRYSETYISVRLQDETTLYDFKKPDGRYLIPVSWAVCSTITVEADNLGEAVDIAKKRIDDIYLCTKGVEYIDASYNIDVDTDEDAINAQDYHTIGDIIIKKNGQIERIQ